jgi:hypothetical protein
VTGALDEVVTLQERIKDLEEALGQNNRDLAVTFHLTPSLNNLMGLLLSVRSINAVMVRQRLEITTDPKVAIWRLRQHLDRWADKNNQPRIDIKSKRTLGYWLEPEEKARIKALMARCDICFDAMPCPTHNTIGGKDGAQEESPTQSTGD